MARFLLALALAICTLTSAAIAVPVSHKNTGNYLTAHNKARRAAKVGPLYWSLDLAHEANQIVQDQSNIKTCNFTKLVDGNYGVNQWRSIGLLGCTPQTVVDQWLEQKANYDEETKSCELNKQCGSYLQVVARNSMFLGCAEATCIGTSTGGCLATCLYNPPARRMA